MGTYSVSGCREELNDHVKGNKWDISYEPVSRFVPGRNYDKLSQAFIMYAKDVLKCSWHTIAHAVDNFILSRPVAGDEALAITPNPNLTQAVYELMADLTEENDKKKKEGSYWTYMGAYCGQMKPIVEWYRRSSDPPQPGSADDLKHKAIMSAFERGSDDFPSGVSPQTESHKRDFSHLED